MNLDDKIKRNSNYLKIFMLLIFLVQTIEIYQSVSIELRDVISIFGALVLFTGFLLSPVLLVTPMNPLSQWFKAFSKISNQSYYCFILGFLLVLFSGTS